MPKLPPAIAAPRTIKGTERVLVVDDELDIADWLKMAWAGRAIRCRLSTLRWKRWVPSAKTRKLGTW